MNTSLELVEDVTGLLNISVYLSAHGIRSFLRQSPISCLKTIRNQGSLANCGFDTRNGAEKLYDSIRELTLDRDDFNFRFDSNGDAYEPSYDINRYSRDDGYTTLGQWTLDRGLNLNVKKNDKGRPLMYWPDFPESVLVTSNCSCNLNETGMMLIGPLKTRAPMMVTPRPEPCNNETVFWSMYGLVAEQLKNCQCPANDTKGGDGEGHSKKELKAIAIGLGIGFAILFVLLGFMAFAFLFYYYRKRGKKQIKQENKPNEIPVRVFPPSFSSTPSMVREQSQSNGSLPYRRNVSNMSGLNMRLPVDTIPEHMDYLRRHSAQPVSPFSNESSLSSNRNSLDPTLSNRSSFMNIISSVRGSQELTQLVERWSINGRRISFGEQLGQGRFGIVYKGKLTASETLSAPVQEVAIKVLKSLNPETVVQFLQEGFIMQGFDHPNILKLIGISVINEEPHIVVPFMRNGNLRDFLQSEGSSYSSLSYDMLIDFCIQICSGMEYLAKNKCVHRDLACRNILVGDTNLLKIADFGLARDLFENDYYS